MKKENIVTITLMILVVCVVLIGIVIFESSDAGESVAAGESEVASDSQQKENVEGKARNDSPQEQADLKNTEMEEKEPTVSGLENSPPQTLEPKGETSMKGSLFIGDSRTVGIMEYAGIKEATFFSNIGMSVYSVSEDTVSVPNVGKVTLEQLLSQKKYDKIYVMLGINELGYEFEDTVSRYKNLIADIRAKQPEAYIFIQANLHVTKSRSDSDKIVNNNAINRFNDAISRLADNKEVFYIDVNPLFDDGAGNLSADKSGDSTHVYGKCYSDWGQWIMERTASLLKEG